MHKERGGEGDGLVNWDCALTLFEPVRKGDAGRDEVRGRHTRRGG